MRIAGFVPTSNAVLKVLSALSFNSNTLTSSATVNS